MKLTDEELDKIMENAGLMLAEPHNPKGSYREGDWLLTRCRRCGVVAHYRLTYILEKTQIGEPVCRACYWPGWYEWGHKLDAQVIQKYLDRATTSTSSLIPALFPGITLSRCRRPKNSPPSTAIALSA